MAALVCGKRSNSIFSDDQFHASPPSSKRIRCSAAGFFSPSGDICSSPPPDNSAASDPLACLKLLFPDLDQEFIKRAFEASGYDLDSAIKSLHTLLLEPEGRNLAIAESKASAGLDVDSLLSMEGNLNHNVKAAASLDQSPNSSLPKDGREWVELIVREMTIATNMDDARARAAKALEMLEKSIATRAYSDATEGSQKENVMLKERVQELFRENDILKRAVTIQHGQLKEFDDRIQELQHLKEIVVPRQEEQMRTLKMNNYALALHLRQAEQNSSMPGKFHPDIF